MLKLQNKCVNKITVRRCNRFPALSFPPTKQADANMPKHARVHIPGEFCLGTVTTLIKDNL